MFKSLTFCIFLTLTAQLLFPQCMPADNSVKELAAAFKSSLEIIPTELGESRKVAHKNLAFSVEKIFLGGPEQLGQLKNYLNFLLKFPGANFLFQMGSCIEFEELGFVLIVAEQFAGDLGASGPSFQFVRQMAEKGQNRRLIVYRQLAAAVLELHSHKYAHNSISLSAFRALDSRLLKVKLAGLGQACEISKPVEEEAPDFGLLDQGAKTKVVVDREKRDLEDLALVIAALEFGEQLVLGESALDFYSNDRAKKIKDLAEFVKISREGKKEGAIKNEKLADLIMSCFEEKVSKRPNAKEFVNRLKEIVDKENRDDGESKKSSGFCFLCGSKVLI